MNQIFKTGKHFKASGCSFVFLHVDVILKLPFFCCLFVGVFCFPSFPLLLKNIFFSYALFLGAHDTITIHEKFPKYLWYFECEIESCSLVVQFKSLYRQGRQTIELSSTEVVLNHRWARGLVMNAK